MKLERVKIKEIVRATCFVGLSILLLIPPVVRSERQCVNHEQCSRRGEQCERRFQHCPIGVCACPEGKRRRWDGKCMQEKLGGESCSAGDICPPKMSCSGGRCRCHSGYMTQNRQHCLLPNEKVLGQACHVDDRCMQLQGNVYTRSKLACRDGICRCRHGYKERGRTCTQRDIGEYGCSEHDHCQGGALCISHKCVCPTNYIVAAAGTKCVKRTAERDLAHGEPCDEVHETRYCGKGLACVLCGDQYICDKDYNPPPGSAYSVHGSLGVVHKILVFLIASLTVFFTSR